MFLASLTPPLTLKSLDHLWGEEVEEVQFHIHMWFGAAPDLK
jgi:hypothetical protein